MSRRLLTLVALFGVVAAACTSGGARPPATAPPSASPGATTGAGLETLPESDPMVKVACGLPDEWLIRIARGYRSDRSAELQILPEEPNFVGAGLPHVGPWDYTSEVPMFFYGPGFIKPLGVVDQNATSADIAPTWARLLGFDAFEAPDGEPITDVLVPPEERSGPPKLIVTVIWDGAGRSVLREWEGHAPNLERLVSHGAWIERAQVGSSPTSSAQIHATIGTGAFPRTHGIVGHSMRIDGRIVNPWAWGARHFLVPTLADSYDLEMGNEPLVGMLGTVAIQLGLIGHGSMLEGADQDLVVLRESPQALTLGAEGVRWNLEEPLTNWFRYPAYANGLRPELADLFPEYDRLDGVVDGAWRGHVLDEDVIQGGFKTPARIPYQTNLIEAVIEREGFGRDDVPDLLFVNYTLIDQIGHIFTLNSEEMRDSIETQDRFLPVLIAALNRLVGEGEWALLITADHGATPDPLVSGAFQISAERLHQGIQEAFDGDGDDVPVAEQVKQTEIFLNTAELEEHGFTLDDVARHVMGLTQEELAIPDVSRISDPGARVFEAAFPASIIPGLPCLPEELRAPPAT